MTSMAVALEAEVRGGGATPRAMQSALPLLALHLQAMRRRHSRLQQTLPSGTPAVTPKCRTRASGGLERDACPLPSALMETGEVQTSAVP